MSIPSWNDVEASDSYSARCALIGDLCLQMEATKSPFSKKILKAVIAAAFGSVMPTAVAKTEAKVLPFKVVGGTEAPDDEDEDETEVE